MPPPMSRFQGGPNTISPYHQQFPSHAPSHPSNQHASLGNPSYLNPSSQMSPFGGNGALGLAGGGFGMGPTDSGLGSQAARMGFQHGAQLQQQQQQSQQHHHQHSAHVMGDHPTGNQGKTRIREVWKHNLHEEMAMIRDLVDDYPFIAMDTEFPGVVSRPMGSFRGKSDYHYQCMRTNVDLLKVIQIGITLFNHDGQTPPARPVSTDSQDITSGGRRGNQALMPCSWQFNFKFSLQGDMYNQVSIDSLMAAGIDFSVLDKDGIDPVEFAALLIPSGLVCFDNVYWISFHGGYDFGYLTKLLHCRPLPADEIEFDQIMKKWFPATYDVKHLMKHAIRQSNMGQMTPQDPSTTEILQKFEHKAGLEHIAETLKVERIGSAHQAGSDSLITGKVFFQIREKIYNGEIPDEHIGKIWGLHVPDIHPATVPGGPPADHSASHHHHPSPGTAGGANGTNGGPSTPNTGSVGLASTPAANSHNTNSMTPGGGGGVFGSFAFSGAR